jgi:hypothetical protein
LLVHARTACISAVLVVAALLSAGAAEAQRKPKPPQPACGLTSFPMIPGYEWTYEPVAPPNPPSGPRPKPKQPIKLRLKVLAVQPSATNPAETEIQLQESFTLAEGAQEQSYQTRLTCTKDALNVPPESFLFAGEPGGGLNITLGELTREGNSYIFRKGLITVPPTTGELIENIKTTFTRTAHSKTKAEMANGSLDIQRLVRIGINETVSTAAGSFDTIPVQVDLRGNLTLDVKPEPQTFSIPANTISKLWFAPNVGIVQVYNPNVHLYQLSDFQQPDPTAASAPAGK